MYATYRLVESYRNTAGKVRQQTLLHLGVGFSIDKIHWGTLVARIEAISRGQQTLIALEESLEKEAQRISKLLVKNAPKVDAARATARSSEQSNPSTDYQRVDLNTVRHQHVRRVGVEHLGLSAAEQLQLPAILSSLGFNAKQVNIALGNIITRLVQPGSERATHYYLTEQSGLDELLGADFSALPLKSLYQISDQLMKHKAAIEAALYQREQNLFNLTEVVMLYDLTNTYCEGRCLANPKAQYGRSKEKRSDCPLVTLGMLLDSSGFPKRSDLFPGNASEPATLQMILTQMVHNKKPTIVMDAGIATEENLTWLKSEGYYYIVVSRKQCLVMPEAEKKTLVKSALHNQVEVCLVKNEATEELELYCHSEAKEEKTKQMLGKMESRYLMELEKCAAGLSKKQGMKKYSTVLTKLGRIKEKYKKIAQYYEVSVETDEEKTLVIVINWSKKGIPVTKEKGIYCLRSNRCDLDAETLWKTYTMLTELEAAFRSLKSELGLRPIYHQKENRIDGHLFISTLAYHLLHTIRYQLKESGIGKSWERIRNIFSTQCRITTTFQHENGKTVEIRKTTSPDTNQRLMYEALNIKTHPGKTQKRMF